MRGYVERVMPKHTHRTVGELTLGLPMLALCLCLAFSMLACSSFVSCRVSRTFQYAPPPPSATPPGEAGGLSPVAMSNSSSVFRDW